MTVIAVDLDGTLAVYHGWMGEEFIGSPIRPMLRRVQKWIDDGVEVVIFTARANDESSIPIIQAWLKLVGLPELEVTNIKKKEFSEFWDDRAVRVIRNTGALG